jgi:hypothetical protein
MIVSFGFVCSTRLIDVKCKMKLFAVLLMLNTSLVSARPGDRLPPDREMVKVQRGFALKINGRLPLPVTHGGAAFVVQKGVLYPGIWAWRHGKFIVLASLDRPDYDRALDPAAPSCQVSMEIAPAELAGLFNFQVMMPAGYMADRQVTLYGANGSGKYFITCLTAEAAHGGLTKFYARDMEEAWGNLILEVQER